MNNNIDIEKIITQIVALTSTLGAGGTMLVLKYARRLTRKLFRTLMWIMLAGIALLAFLISRGQFSISDLIGLFNK